MTAAGPSLSVVIAATDSARAVESCLRSLGHSDRVEVIVVAACDRVAPEVPPPGVRWIAAEPGCGVPRLRRLGLERASAPVVAFTEDSCRLEAGWREAWLDAFRDPTVLAATGPVEHAQGGSIVDWAVFFCEYAPFLRPHAGTASIEFLGQGDRLAGNNFTARRAWLLEANGEDDGVHEHALPTQITARSGRVVRVSGAVALHARCYSAREALADRLRFGLDFGRLRAASEPGGRRIAATVLGPAILPIQLAKLAVTMARNRRHLARFVAASPVTTALLTTWSVGEWLGWMLGPRRPPAPRPAGRRRGTGARPDGPAPGPAATPRPGCTAPRGAA